MYAGRVACCLLVRHGEYTDGTDRQTDGLTPDRYITLSARAAMQRKKESKKKRAKYIAQTFSQ